MARFFTPRWMAAHVTLVVVVAACAVLGLWQLRRLGERRVVNQRIEEARSRPPVALAPPGEAATGDLRYRSVEIRGAYDPEREVLVAGRSLDGRPGHHVLTPLVAGDGRWGVLVERGWVPYELDSPPVAEAAPPDGGVRAVGVVLPSERSRAAPGSGSTRVDVLARPDVRAVAASLPYEVHPFYVRLQAQEPTQPGELPALVPPPEPTEGPHLAYAAQWFLFGAVAIGVYVALLRRDARRRSAPTATAEISQPQPRIRESP